MNKQLNLFPVSHFNLQPDQLITHNGDKAWSTNWKKTSTSVADLEGDVGSSQVDLELDAHDDECAVYSVKGVLVEKRPFIKDLEYSV